MSALTVIIMNDCQLVLAITEVQNRTDEGTMDAAYGSSST